MDTAAPGPQDRWVDQWIKNFRADQHWVKEDAKLWASQSILSLIWWEDESQLIDQENFEEESGRGDRTAGEMGLTNPSRGGALKITI